MAEHGFVCEARHTIHSTLPPTPAHSLSFAFNNVAIEDILELSVYDYNKVRKDGIMGTGSLALREAFEEGRIDTRIPLSNKTGSKDAGEVWINIRTEGVRPGRSLCSPEGKRATSLLQ